MKVDADRYLDKRKSEWVNYEMEGKVKYDPLTRLVHVSDTLTDVLEAIRIHG